MATNLDIDPDLLAHAFDLSGEKTKKAAVTKALEEFIARRERERLADLLVEGGWDWDPDYDYKAERGGRRQARLDEVAPEDASPSTSVG